MVQKCIHKQSFQGHFHRLRVKLLGNEKERDKQEARFQATADGVGNRSARKGSQKAGLLVTTLSNGECFMKTNCFKGKYWEAAF